MEKTDERTWFDLKRRARVTRKEEGMTHTDVKMDEFAAGLIFPVQP